jgi:hypothetical protein
MDPLRIEKSGCLHDLPNATNTRRTAKGDAGRLLARKADEHIRAGGCSEKPQALSGRPEPRPSPNPVAEKIRTLHRAPNEALHPVKA